MPIYTQWHLAHSLYKQPLVMHANLDCGRCAIMRDARMKEMLPDMREVDSTQCDLIPTLIDNRSSVRLGV